MAALNAQLLQVGNDEPAEVVYTDNARKIFIAKLREAADRMETGELRGVSLSWVDSGPMGQSDPEQMGDMHIVEANEWKQKASRRVTKFQPPALKVVGRHGS